MIGNISRMFFAFYIKLFFLFVGLCYALAQLVGSLSSGFVIYRLQLSLSRQIKMILLLLVCAVTLLLLLFPVGCENGGFQWQNVSLRSVQ
jgi:hypothetical protein